MLTPQLQAAIVATVACGDTNLKKLVEDELPLIYACLDDVCNERVRYYHAQLAAIELAQIYSRNRIDEAQRNMAHETRETFSMKATRVTDAEGTTTGRSCSWSAATSQQNFVRDSTEDMTAFHEQNLLRTAERLEDGFDRSSRSTVGNGASFSLVTHIVNNQGGNVLAAGAGQESRVSNRTSSTSGGTAPLLPLVGTNWPIGFINFATFPPSVGGADPGPFADINGPVNNSEALCPDPVDEDLLGVCNTFNEPYSAGQGVFQRNNFSIGIPPFSVSFNWSAGFNQRQYFHCSGSRVNGTHSSRSRMDHLNSATTTALPEDNGSFSNETSSVIHFVRKNGSSTRRGTETVDAEERSNGYADGNAHNRSERDSKANAFMQTRAESLTKGNSVSTLRRTETLTDDEVRRSYGQISEHLTALWQRIWNALHLLEKQQAAVPVGGSMACVTNALGCKDCTQYVPLLSRPQYRQATRIAL